MTGALRVIALLLGVVLVGSPAWGGEAILLNDAELDEVYGGEPSEDGGVIIINSSPGASVSLSGSAQANANAMIIVNNAGGTVSAQVNMVTYLNGSSGNAIQTNVGLANGVTLTND